MSSGFDAQSSEFDVQSSGFDAQSFEFDALSSDVDVQSFGFDILSSNVDAPSSGFDFYLAKNAKERKARKALIRVLSGRVVHLQR